MDRDGGWLWTRREVDYGQGGRLIMDREGG